MTRKRLIFFAGADPRTDPGPVAQAYHFATVAAGAGLDAEVRLAKDAVRVAQPDGVARTAAGEALRAQAREGVDARYQVTLCPNCVQKQQVSDAQMAGIGGVERDLSEILTEVAEGRSELIYLG